MALFQIQVDIDSMVTGVITQRTLYKLKELDELGPEGKYIILQFCMKLGMIADRYTCPLCKKDMKLRRRSVLSDGYQWSCQTKTNKHQISRSVRSGSWFSESRLSIIDILILTYFFVVKRPHKDCLFECGVSSSTVADWRQFYREVCVEFCIRNSQKIGGVGIVVEIDESKFERKYNHVKRVRNGMWVYGGVEKGESRKCFMQVVPTRGKDTLLQVIKDWVLPGTTIISDCWQSYNCLLDEGFVHMKVNHSYNFADPLTGEHTNSAAKRSMPRRKVDNCFDLNLSDNIWERMTQNSRDPMKEFIKEIIQVYPPSTEDALEKN